MTATIRKYYATVFSIAPSDVNKDWIWAGSDDGKVWFTNKGGGTWHNVTPADLAEFSRVTMIDPGHASNPKGRTTAASDSGHGALLAMSLLSC